MPLIDGARLAQMRDAIKMPRLPSWWKRKDVTAERRAIAAQVHPILIWGLFVAAYGAAFVEVCFMFLRVIRMTGDYSWRVEYVGGSEGVLGWKWEASFTSHPLLAGILFLASAVVVWFSMFWVPSQIALRGQGFWRRATLIVVGIICNLYILSNVVVGGQANRTEDLRDSMVVAEQAGATREALQREIDGIDQQLRDMRDRTRTNEYAALAATVGVEEYQRLYICDECLARERDPARRELLRRAIGAASRADGLEADRAALQERLLAAPTQAAVAVQLTDRAGEGMATFASYVDAYQYVGLGLALSLVAILGQFWGVGLLQARALFDPSVEEKQQTNEDEPTDEPVDDPANQTTGPAPPDDELILPPLPDHRTLKDPEFDEVQLTVDEQGRRQRKVGQWRTAPPRDPEPPPAAGPAAGSDGPADPSEPPPASNAADDGGVEDLAAEFAKRAREAQAQREPTGAK